ncbi:GDSL-like lipase/acylhydrolase family protein [Nitzschia inconspicua]|uniref:GDSL-like lipase/acylhydrolase family protein n=1 Tax=Nitzschia inconspicua TaxID=303405 RepID=A0A9K3KXZ6_9STRA|nr:GDSL-like lipase/acylhydrolase family protein [Nitzschia inconspicua]
MNFSFGIGVQLLTIYLSLVSSWSSPHNFYRPTAVSSLGRSHGVFFYSTGNGYSRHRVCGPIGPSVRDGRLTSTLGDVVSSSFTSTDATLYSSFLLALEGAVSSVDNLRKIQRLGENLFAGILSVAILQGAVALGQYRTNPTGQLIVPPGRTIGVAHPKTTAVSVSNQTLIPRGSSSTLLMKEGPTTATLLANASAVIAQSATTTTPSTTSDFPNSTKLSSGTSRYARTLNRINRWLVLLVPWIGRQFSFLLSRNTHFFHLAFIFVFSRIFDSPYYWSFRLQRLKGKVFQRDMSSTITVPSGGDGETMDARTTETLESKHTRRWTVSRPIQNLVVLGDSLAVGLGSVDIFDANKNNTLDYDLIQNLDTDTPSDETGPIFPRVLAETLAEKEGIDVAWRSAGVDGGNAQHIQDFCLEVLKDEVEQGRPPQLVVVLCGINDLKLYMSKPWWGGNPGPRAFRQRLRTLIDSIHAFAPEATIVLPAIPTQMFHKNSPMNIFPFNFVMDSLIGFWDSQKMGVANRVLDGEDDIFAPATFSNLGAGKSQKGRVLYIRTEPNDVLKWYNLPNPLGEPPTSSSLDHRKDEGLIAADGVHPNAKCYALWAKTLADQLLP